MTPDLKDILERLASIPLWRDHYPDGPDMFTESEIGRYFTVQNVRDARELISKGMTG